MEIILVALILLGIWMIFHVWQENTVKESSERIKKLLELNEQTEFLDGFRSEFFYDVNLSTKPKFDRFDLNTLYDDAVRKDEQLYNSASNVLKNQQIYHDYQQKTAELESTITPEESKKTHIGYKKYKIIEEKLFCELMKKPILTGSVTCVANYRSPKGRNSYSKRKEYTLNKVLERYEELKQIDANSQTEMARRSRERALMTDKLRYSILKRDGFRCQICGRTAQDGVKLHVDHIIPVSKGGRTIPSNLRTLCEDCNLGKSDELE